MQYENLTYEQGDDHVVVLTYNRPDQRNAISRAMNKELHHAWQRFRDDDDAFVLVGAPRTSLPGAELAGSAYLFARASGDLVATLRERGRATRRAILPLLTPIIILGGILSGIFTPTEASA